MGDQCPGKAVGKRPRNPQVEAEVGLRLVGEGESWANVVAAGVTVKTVADQLLGKG